MAAGIKARISEKYQVRVDFRQYLTGKPFGGSDGVPGISGNLVRMRYQLDLGLLCRRAMRIARSAAYECAPRELLSA